jgi:serine-type D-Ala-D-Ala carboxypeptidase (penicillin-binding protein 5/6)
MMVIVYQQYQQTQYKKKKRGLTLKIVLAVLLIGLPLGASLYVTFIQEPPAVQPTFLEQEPTTPEPVSLPWPTEGIAAVGAEGYGLLDSSVNPDEPVPIASIAKLFLAVAVMRERPFALGEPGETIGFTQRDVDSYIAYVEQLGSVYPVAAGQTMTQYEAMQALLIPSANNIADALAIWAFGSVQNYLAYANDMAVELGLESTFLADASGFSPDSISSAADLVMIAEAALDNEVIADIVARSEVVIDPAVGPVYNTNLLLGEPGVIGVKTGTTDEAGANLLFAADHALTESATQRIFAVVLGQPDRQVVYQVAPPLLSATKQGFGFVQVLDEQEVVGYYQAPWTDVQVPIVSAGGALVPAWVGAELSAELEGQVVPPGVALSEAIGEASIQHGVDTTVVPLIAQGAVPSPSLWWRLGNLVGIN